MRYICLTLAFFLVSCQLRQDETADKKRVETVLQNYFTAISQSDYQPIRDQCTDDFVLIEHGLWWNNDSLIKVIKGFEGKATIGYTLDDIDTHVEGSIAWMTYKNHGLMIMDGKETQFEWSESAVFRKQHDAWKMVLLHSTLTSPM